MHRINWWLRRHAEVLAILLALAGLAAVGCTPPHEDLQQWMAEQRRQTLPKVTPIESTSLRRVGDAAIAGVGGLAVGGLIYALMTRDFAFPTIADYHLANAKALGGGTNVVNVILVDFRGYDTFGEITVLGIAATLIYALTETILRPGPANDRLRNWVGDTPDAGDRHPLMMVVAEPVSVSSAIRLTER